MAHCLNDEVPYRIEWCLSEVLPGEDQPVTMSFELHKETWEFKSFFDTDDLIIVIDCKKYYNEYWNVSVGFVNGSGEEVKVSKTQFYCATYRVHHLATRSKLNSMQQSHQILRFFVEIKRKKEKSVSRKAVKRKIRPDYETMFRSGQDSDIIIQVKEKKFNCHKNILGVRSPVFAAMLNTDMKESTTGVITITDSEPNVFHEFLLYLYTGNGAHLSWTEVTELYQLADKYNVESLRNLCIRRINEKLSMENFLHFLELSQQRADAELSNMVEQFFIKNEKQIVGSEMWVALLNKNPTTCNVLINALTLFCIKQG